MASDPELQKLEEALSSGVKSVFSEGDRVEFQSADQLIKAHQHISRQKRGPRRLRAGRVRLSCSI